MRKTATRLNVILVATIFIITLSAPPSMSAPPPPPIVKPERVSAPIEYKLEHAVSLDDAMAEAATFSIPVVGFTFSNPTVTGAFMPSPTYSKENFLGDFADEHSTLPQVDGFLTAPDTVEEAQKAKSKIVPVKAPRFEAPQPPKKGSKTQQELSTPLEDSDAQMMLSSSTTSWWPIESEVRTYEQDGNAVLKSSYKWNQNGGSLGHLDPDFGLEVEVNLESDGAYSGPGRPNCFDSEDLLVSDDDLKKHFWAQNQNWSSWSVATQFAQAPGAASIESYADYNDLVDGCNTQSIAVGIGKPTNIPGQDQATYGFRVSIVAPLGEVPKNHLYQAGLQPVEHNCGLPWDWTAHTDCMGVLQTPYPDPNEKVFVSLNENGAAYPTDPATRVPVHTPGACWTLVTYQIPQRIDCVHSFGADAYQLAGWGGNYAGELGRGNEDVVPTAAPAALGALQGVNISQMSSNSTGYTNCAVAAVELWCWGHGSYGALGNGSVTNSSTPVKVDMTGAMAGTVVTQVQTSYGNACATASGKPFCWGYWATTGLNDQSAVPVAIDTTGALAGKTVTDLAVANSTACVVADGRPYCWGVGSTGQLGNGGTTSSQYPVPVDVSGALAGREVTQVAAVGNKTMCALADAKAFCWGDNYYGYLGNGTTTNSSVPVAVGGPLATRNVTALSDGYSPCAIADGAAYCWGPGSSGLLGTGVAYGSLESELLPRAVDTSGILAGKTVTHIVQGDSHTCVLASGQPYCWGENYDGTLGNDFDPNGTAWSPTAVHIAGTVLEGKTISGLMAGGGATIAVYEP